MPISDTSHMAISSYSLKQLGRMYYSTINPDACKPYNETIDLSGDPDSDVSPFILADRGNCSFVTKARNIQNWAGKVAVIIDRKENDPESTIMIDDGTGSDITISTILISQQDGDVLKSFYLQNTTKYVHLGMSFKIDAPDDRVEYDVFYTLGDMAGIRLIHSLKESNARLGKHALFTPHIHTYYSKSYMKEGDCVLAKKYCMPVQDHSIKLQGKQLIEEGLRQQCIYNTSIKVNNAEPFWEYIDKILEYCPGNYTQSCSYRAMSAAKISKTSIEECVNNSYVNDDNTILKHEQQIYEMASIQYLPAVTVNNLTLRGKLESKSIFQTICNGFSSKPRECTTTEELQENKVSGWMIVMLIVLLLLINLLLFYFYKRSTKKDISTMDFYVSAAVTNYMAMKDRNSKSP